MSPKYFSILIAALALAIAVESASAGILYNPVVIVEGDGVAALSSAGAVVNVNMYAHSTLNSLITSVAFNSGATGTRLVNSGSATSEGILSNNPALADNAAKGLPSSTGFVFNAGYNAAAATASVASAAGIDRAVGFTSVAIGTLGTPTVGATGTQAQMYDTNNIRGSNGNNTATAFYTAGTATTAALGGWAYLDSVPTNLQVSASITNVRTVETLNGQLFGTSGSGSFIGVSSIGTGTPLITGNTATLMVADTGTSPSPYEFVLINDPANNADTTSTFGFDTAYMADDRTAGNGGGIRKYTWNGTAWALVYVLNLDTGATGFRGLAGQLDPDTGHTFLWATVSAGTALYEFSDNGAAVGTVGPTGSTFLKIADAPTNELFRGVALSPAPEPTSLVLLLAGGTVLLSVRRKLG